MKDIDKGAATPYCPTDPILPPTIMRPKITIMTPIIFLLFILLSFKIN